MPVSETEQQDGEGLDGGDKPPIHRSPAPAIASAAAVATALKAQRPPTQQQPVPITTNGAHHSRSPSAATGKSHRILPANGQQAPQPQPQPLLPPQPRPRTTSAASSSPGYSSDDDSASIGSSRPPSRAEDGISSRRPSSSKPSRPSSVKSLKSDDGGQKFTLKDLLGGSAGLRRKGSARSDTSSRKSDSDQSSAEAPDAGSTASLLKKYGVCGRAAIGKGATSVVRLAHKWDRAEEKLYAVKEFRKRRKNETEKEYVKKLTSEFCISSTLHHPNVVETVDLVQDENHNWCEVMEYCPGGDLYAVIKKGGMTAPEVECCFRQMLSGVAYLHSQGVAHRDIKPENLFFDGKGHLKIGDYGASTVYRLPWEATVHKSTGLCGSEPYIAPEQFLNTPYDARLVDVWACGIVYYCMHFHEIPWRVAQMSDPLYATYAQACATSPTSCPPTISSLKPRECRPLIRKMLEPDPKQRALIEDVVKHPWVQSIEVCTTGKPVGHTHVLVLPNERA